MAIFWDGLRKVGVYARIVELALLQSKLWKRQSIWKSKYHWTIVNVYGFHSSQAWLILTRIYTKSFGGLIEFRSGLQQCCHIVYMIDVLRGKSSES